MRSERPPPGKMDTAEMTPRTSSEALTTDVCFAFKTLILISVLKRLPVKKRLYGMVRLGIALLVSWGQG